MDLKIDKYLSNTISKIMEIIKTDLADEIEKRGHSNTGKLVDSLEIKINRDGDNFTGEVLWNDYGGIVDQGVKRNKIPFGKSTGAKVSKYIQALIEYFKTKGFVGREAKSIAFGTANKHRREGMSTRASRRFSSIGKRQNMVKEVVKVSEGKIINLFNAEIVQDIEIRLTNNVEEFFKNVA